MSTEESTTGKTRKRKLIEVAFPLEEVSAHSRRDKNIRHGHISTLHIWWARRPLAACRAFIYASLVDDPETDEERDSLLKEVADLASWDAVRHPDRVVRARTAGGSGLTGRALLERARTRILACNGGVRPRVLDPFAGGGAIPLEALRLGCDAEASDLNPVAVLILKGTLEYPQLFGRSLAQQTALSRRGEQNRVAGIDGQVPEYIRESASLEQSSFRESDALRSYENNPLAVDVRFWGEWILARAHEELAEYYPTDQDGGLPVAYLWSRTLPCPSCGSEMPLIRQYWLARKPKRSIALAPVIDRSTNSVDFKIEYGSEITDNPSHATTNRADSVCLICGQVAKADYVHSAGKQGQLGERLTAVVLTDPRGQNKYYRTPNATDYRVFEKARIRLQELESEHVGDISLIPDEPLARHPQYMLVREYGLDNWGKLFNARQLLSLITFSRLVGEAHEAMCDLGLDEEYARAISLYLGLAVDRLADRGSTLCRWDPSPKMESLQNTFGRQALPMVWDFGEGVPFSDASGGFATCISWILLFLELEGAGTWPGSCSVLREDARTVRKKADLCVTDPPYYDAINYADLSDFFFVWLKRSLGHLYPSELSAPLTPKKDQLVVNVHLIGEEEKKMSVARRRYLEGMSESFRAIHASLSDPALVGIVFAHTASDAWAALIEGLLDSGFTPDSSWPVDTELPNKLSAGSRANLKTSVWMACRPTVENAGSAFIGDVFNEMRPVIRERLLYFWSQGIRGADFFISAIGPALSIFGRHSAVLRPDGSEVTVRDFLDLVRREATTVALEQVLGGAELGSIDEITSQYLTWVWSYGKAPLDTGEAIALGLATGADYRDVVRSDSIAVEVKEKSKKLARLRTIRERAREDEELGQANGARPTPLIDQLQHAAALWGDTKPGHISLFRAKLGEHRWAALRTLGQAVAECLPEGDEDRRLINGLLSSAVMGVQAPRVADAEAKAGQQSQQLSIENLD